MKHVTLSAVATIVALMMGSTVASALTAKTSESTKLRAGPAFDFPVVDRLPDGVKVNVHGCVRAYAWCDISWRDARGWVPGEELVYLYRERYVPIVEYGPRIGLSIVVFSFDDYWDRHYRGRPWYGERTRWRTAWRAHDGGGKKKDADRASSRHEDKVQAGRRQSDEDRHQSADHQSDHQKTNRDRDQSNAQSTNCPAASDDRSHSRVDRGEPREGGGSRALSPGNSHRNPDARREHAPEHSSPEHSSGGSEDEPDRSGGGAGRQDNRKSN